MVSAARGIIWLKAGMICARAGHALTHFKPGESDLESETSTDTLVQNASRWGLLASEVSENDRQVEVRLEAPGMEPDNFEIKMIGNTLVIQGDKRIERRGELHIILPKSTPSHIQRIRVKAN